MCLLDLCNVDDKSKEEGVPSSNCIIQDCDRVLHLMEVVCKNKGKIVPGVVR